MRITEVIVNHTERNYFNDYDEIRSDRMADVRPENVVRAIDKLVRRFKSMGTSDVMFVKYDDGTGYRLMYQRVDMESYEHPVFGTMWRGGHDAPMLRHFTHYSTDSWDKEEVVTVAQAKRRILGGEQK